MKKFHTNNRYSPRPKRPDHLINESIRYPQVRIKYNGNSQVVDTKLALQFAKEKDLDLVLIAEKAKPPVCEIIDYQKFLYQEKKRKEEAEKKQREANKDTKEVRFTSNISDHDVETKKNHIEQFLIKKHKVRLKMMFKGRNIRYKERGEIILLNIIKDLADVSKPDALPKMQGRDMLVTLLPK
jgi:translation initiation factor IF-3